MGACQVAWSGCGAVHLDTVTTTREAMYKAVFCRVRVLRLHMLLVN